MLASTAATTYECEQIVQGDIAGTDIIGARGVGSSLGKLNNEQFRGQHSLRMTGTSKQRCKDLFDRPAITIFGCAGTGKALRRALPPKSVTLGEGRSLVSPGQQNRRWI